MKKVLFLALAATSLTFASCETKKEEATENAAEGVRDNAEMKADAMEDQADSVRNQADNKADAMEERADDMPAAGATTN